LPEALRVCLNATLSDGLHGGVQQIVIGLAQGLSQLDDAPGTYQFLAYRDSCEWLKPYLKGPCALLEGPAAPRPARGLKRWLKPLKGLPPFKQRLEARALQVPASGGWAEKAGAQAIHFPYQEGFLTALPSFYQPHDLQHLSYPENFSAQESRRREAVYRRLCQQAEAVVLMSRWGKRDLMQRYGQPSEKVAVVAGGSVTGGYPSPGEEDLRQLRAAFDLPERFFYYPAQTFPHKNHARLLRALKVLKDEGLTVGLVCSGARDQHYPALARLAASLGLSAQVRFVGFVSPVQVAGLYRLCQGMVFPSLFEGWGLPVTEALENGVPVACADASCLPEQVQGAALLFDPLDEASIAAALRRLWTEEALREALAEKGRARARDLTWASAARSFRALYRRAAGQPLDEEDQSLVRACFEL
jgi:glycosyltransferase involved in cell wall biosynthesis